MISLNCLRRPAPILRRSIARSPCCLISIPMQCWTATAASAALERKKNGPQLKARPKFREETPRRRTVRPQPAIVTATHTLMSRTGMSSGFFETSGIVEDSGSDQGVRPHPATKKCAAHKDLILTMGDLPASSFVDPPPKLDRLAALFLDVDGTLLEIAARSDLVRVPPKLPALLGGLGAQRG